VSFIKDLPLRKKKTKIQKYKGGWKRPKAVRTTTLKICRHLFYEN